ncbi:hypothetical protein OIU77_011329 [Salix suchowensis]|uniref:Uncharacterized protein n=1 Tax=Salix suchowensis TaxID=1278906 RepID=A0ABQ9A1I8_9ROSI|nr:hypothetical protein OIU77_011329 [Salix suchowensis]
MGCGKSKHDVAAGNTITRKKSDVGVQDENVEAVAGVQDANVEAVAGVQDGNVESVAGVQDTNAEAVAGVQDANAEAVADVQDANVEVVSVLQNANESEELKGGGKDVENEEESVVEKQEPGKLVSEEAVAGVQDANVEVVSAEPGKLVSEEAVAGVQDANVEVVSAVQNANDESEELNGGGKDVEIKEESAAEKQEPGKLVSEESLDTVSDGKSEKESLSNESAELDDVGKETLVEKEPKQAAENEEPQATKQEIADVELEVANPITAELEVASPTTN